MIFPRDGYAPGWTGDAIAMMTSRVAEDRASFVLESLDDGVSVVDVGCGPGSLSVGLARAVAPSGSVLGIDAEASQVHIAGCVCRDAGVPNARFEVASAYELPVEDGAVDVYFSHAMFEHLAEPLRALSEARRVLRPDGILAVAVSDWSQARLDPFSDDVAAAMNGHYELRRRAGGDPFAGGRIAGWAESAGFVGVTANAHLRVDLGYRHLANYVHTRIEAALRQQPANERLGLALSAASRWAETDGSAQQCWVEVTAHSPSR